MTVRMNSVDPAVTRSCRSRWDAGRFSMDDAIANQWEQRLGLWRKTRCVDNHRGRPLLSEPRISSGRRGWQRGTSV